MQLDLQERSIVVTGGTKGIGRAAVVKLCASGANVVFQGRDEAAAQATIAAASGVGTTPVFLSGDLYDYAAIADLCASAVARFGALHGAVGNGMRGSPRPHVFRQTDPADFIGYFEQGTLPRAYLARAASEHMAEQGYGKIVLISTDGGRVPTPSESMIGSAAAAVFYMTRAIGKELARDGVRVNSVGITLTKDTPGYDNIMAQREDGSGGTLGKAFEKLEGKMPFGFGDASEVAELIAFLLAPESDGMTGASFSVNRGGYFPVFA